MLLRFRVANFLSIAEEQELSLVSAKLKGPTGGLINFESGGKLQVLPSAVVYGANASGKTNLILALRFMINATMYSHRKASPGGGVPRYHYALGDDFKRRPSMFEADFVVGTVRYVYGFECTDDRFTEEWLYAYPEGKRRKLFERENDKVYFGATFKGVKKPLVEFMRPNSLFVATATQNDHETLSIIAKFFSDIKFVLDVATDDIEINSMFEKDEIDPRVIAFLNNIGTGIVDFTRKSDEISENSKKFSEALASLLKEHSKSKEEISLPTDRIRILFGHRGSHGVVEYFDAGRESAGTRRLIIILTLLFKAIDDGSVVVIDEIDTSLHTSAARQILEIFASSDLNSKGAQLICTTHDTNLLTDSFLRRDQIYFSEKNRYGATRIYSLSEIRSRSEDNFEIGYLQGRYGGVPSSGYLDRLLRGAGQQ